MTWSRSAPYPTRCLAVEFTATVKHPRPTVLLRPFDSQTLALRVKCNASVLKK